MASGPISDPRSDAIAWRIRLRDGTTADWEAFAAWLGQDPQNAASYDEVALLDQEMDNTLAAMPAPISAQLNDNPLPAPTTTRRWVVAGVGTAIAAGIAAVTVVPTLISAGPDYYDVTTRAGEHRVVVVGDGNRILMNGASRVRLDRNDVRFASLESGEASFQIRHDANAPFTLEVGNDKLVDIGTSFNVTRYPTGHLIAVSEGAVLYNPDREAVKLGAGQSLKSDEREARIRVSAIDPAEVGSWQQGVLTYRGAPLSDVVSDLSRNLGKPVRVSARLASRSFTGTIEIDRDEGRLFGRLGKLLGIESRRTAEGWELDAPTTSTG